MQRAINHPQRHSRAVRILFWVVTGILAALVFAAVFAVAVTFLWNWLMTDLFSFKPINYFQAFGLVLLARLLVGGWHHGRREEDHSHFRRFFPGKGESQAEAKDFGTEDFNAYWNREGKAAYENYLKQRRGEPG